MLGRRDNRYTTAPELWQVASFSCFAHQEFLSSLHLSKVSGKFRMSLSIFVTCQAIFLELVKFYFQRTKWVYSHLIHHFMIIDSLMLSRTELETCCVLGRRDNRYTTAPEPY